jgi:hypothetical protein
MPMTVIIVDPNALMTRPSSRRSQIPCDFAFLLGSSRSLQRLPALSRAKVCDERTQPMIQAARITSGPNTGAY